MELRQSNYTALPKIQSVYSLVECYVCLAIRLIPISICFVCRQVLDIQGSDGWFEEDLCGSNDFKHVQTRSLIGIDLIRNMGYIFNRVTWHLIDNMIA